METTSMEALVPGTKDQILAPITKQ